MPAWLITLLQILGFAVIILVLFNLLKVYVLSKIKVKSSIVLTAAILVFALPILISGVLRYQLSPIILNYVQMPLFVLLFLWYMDLIGFGTGKNIKKDKKDDIKIRPKAKPNRIKHIHDK